MPYPVGTTIFAFADMAADVSQIFTAGDIHTDTLIQKYVDATKKMDMVEATYWDKDRNYEKTMISARVADWDTSDRLNTPTAMTLYGTNTFNQAYSIIQFILTANQLLDNIVAVSVDVEALAVRAGQVIQMQNDVITTGHGGRIVSVNAGARTVTVDRVVDNTIGVRYDLVIWHNNGTIETREIVGSGPSSATIDIPGLWGSWTTAPVASELYSYGVAGAHLKKYRVTNIGRTNELTRTLTLIQYDDALYESFTPPDGESEAPGQWNTNKIAIPSDTVEQVANLLNLATNLRLEEVLSQNRVTGEYESTVVATWDTVQGDPRGNWEVYFRDVDVSDIDWEGDWEALDAGYTEGDQVIRGGKAYVSLAHENITTPIAIDT